MSTSGASRHSRPAADALLSVRQWAAAPIPRQPQHGDGSPPATNVTDSVYEGAVMQAFADWWLLGEADLGVDGIWLHPISHASLAYGVTFQRGAFVRGGHPRSVFQPDLPSRIATRAEQLVHSCDSPDNFVPMWHAG